MTMTYRGLGRVMLRSAVVIALLAALALSLPDRASAATVNIAVGDPYWFCDMSYSSGECPTTVQVGDTVMWNFPSGTYHSTTECRGSTCDDASPPNPTPLWDSGLHIGGSFSRMFDTPGVYYYMCSFHGYTLMRGKITVVASVGGVAELPGAQPPPAAAPEERSATRFVVPALGALLAAATVGAGAAWYAGRRNVD